MSLRVRLGLAMAAFALALGGLAGTYVYESTVATLGHALSQELRSSATLVTSELARSSLRVGTPGRPVYSHDQAFVQVYTVSGTLLYASATARRDASATRPMAVRAGTTLTQFDVRRRVDGTSYVAGAVRTAASGAVPGVVVVVGSSLDQSNDSAGHLKKLLLAGVPGVGVLAFFVGLILADRALRPVERLRAGAVELRASANTRRLPVPRGRDQLSALARTLNGFLDDVHSLLHRQRVLIASAGHELRTPLALAAADLELALDPRTDPATARRRLEHAAAAVHGLGQLCAGLLELASAEDGALGVELRPAEVGPFLLSVLDRFAHTAAERKVDLVFDVDSPLAAMVDPPHLERALHNVVDNALRFAPPGSAIVVAARRSGGTVELTVADQGPGFPEGLLGSAGQPFARGEARPEAAASGGAGHYGLGLSIATAIVAAHGGTLEVQNAAPGAVVRLRVRAAPGDAQARRPASTGDRRPGEDPATTPGAAGRTPGISAGHASSAIAAPGAFAAR